MKTPEQIVDEIMDGEFGVENLFVPLTPRQRAAQRVALAAIKADRAQRAEILATDDAVNQVLEEMGIDWNVYRPSLEQVTDALIRVGFLVADAMNAQRETTTI